DRVLRLVVAEREPSGPTNEGLWDQTLTASVLASSTPPSRTAKQPSRREPRHGDAGAFPGHLPFFGSGRKLRLSPVAAAIRAAACGSSPASGRARGGRYCPDRS